MNDSDQAILPELRETLLSLTGHAFRADSDSESASAVASASAMLARSLTLLGSGLLAVDASESLLSVADVVSELTRSELASAHFSWHLVPRRHLVGCAMHFLHVALPADSVVMQKSSLETAAVLLEHATESSNVSSERDDDADLDPVLSDADTVALVYLAHAQAINANLSLSSRIENSVSQLLGHATPNALAHALWPRGLFALIRDRMLETIDRPRTNAPIDAVQLAEAFAVARWGAGIHPPYDDSASLLALALPLCSAVESSHRLAGLRVARLLVSHAAEDDTLEEHFDALLECTREAAALAHAGATPAALALLAGAMPPAVGSLAHPDKRREAAARVALDATIRLAEEGARDGGARMHAASVAALSSAVAGAGPALIRRTTAFVALFGSLFSRVAADPSSDAGTLAALSAAFSAAASWTWPRLASSRAPIVRVCIGAVLGAQSRPAGNRSAVTQAAQDVLATLVRCDGAPRTAALLRNLRDEAVGFPSLAAAGALLAEAVRDAEVVAEKREDWDAGREERYGCLVHRFFENGIEVAIDP